MLKYLIFAVVIGIICLGVIYKCFFEINIVRGKSMFPTLQDGDLVLVSKMQLKSKYKVGDVVTLINPNNPRDRNDLVIKRIRKVKKIQDLVFYWIEGDNKDLSHDSRHYGWVIYTMIEGRVMQVWKLKRKSL